MTANFQVVTIQAVYAYNAISNEWIGVTKFYSKTNSKNWCSHWNMYMPVHLWAILRSYVLTFILGFAFESGKPILETSSVNLSVFIGMASYPPL